MLRPTVYLVAVCCLASFTVCSGDGSHTYCRFLDGAHDCKTDTSKSTEAAAQNGDLVHESSGCGEIQSDNRTIRCPENKFCYSFWKADPVDKTKISILKQGCWDHPDTEECSSAECISSPEGNGPKLNNTRFCCCLGDYCNENVTDGYVPGHDVAPSPVATPEYRILQDPRYREKTIIVALVSVISVAVLILVSFLVYRLCASTQKERLEAVHLIEAPPTPQFELDQLKLTGLIDSGRYGEVWRGTLNEQDVAVKIFAPHQKQYYLNEKDIYMLPFMDTETVPKFYGAEERIDTDGILHYFIVMEHITLGTLTHYLSDNTIDWATLCKMCHSVASAMSHLHTDMAKGDKIKPAIAHRDFNTRNILVRPDLSCVVCDFGFAMKIMGSKFVRNGQTENAEQASLTDVGTLRYMAPEVLEGAVNLRDCEASLKQIDVYSLGLILWEIASRCSDLYQGLPVPQYKLPFEAEVGIHPSFQEMQLAVSRNKYRPRFPDVWKDTNQAIRALKETIEDCWDQDAEARLTALCVEERITEMMSLWESRHKGVTPTINPTCSTLVTVGDQSAVVRNQTAPTSHLHHHQGANINTTATESNVNRNSNIPYQPLEELSEPNSRPNWLSSVENSVSTSTVETNLTSSPTDPGDQPPPYSKATRNINYAKANNRVLQPHQGTNPTVERNTHKRSDEELAVLGNTLVDKSVVEAAQAEGNTRHQRGTSASNTDDLIDAIAENLESSLVQNDLLNHNQQQHNSNLPHNYVQSNSSAAPLIVRPKQPNVAGNGSNPPPLQSQQPSRLAPADNTKPKSKFRFKKPDKGKGKLSFFGRNPFSSSKHEEYSDDSANYFPTENLCDPTAPNVHTTLLKQVGHQRSQSDGNSNLAKSNLEPKPVATEVCLMNGAAVVRPMSLGMQEDEDVPEGATAADYNINHNSVQTVPDNRFTGIAQLQAGTSGGSPRLIQLGQKSQSSVDLSPTSSSSTANMSRSSLEEENSSVERTPPRRPNWLAINASVARPKTNGHQRHRNLSDTNQNHKKSSDSSLSEQQSGSSHNSLSMLNYSAGGKKKGGKVPPVKNGHLSLCDDRVLSASAGDMTSTGVSAKSKRAKSNISLQQFGSSEADVNVSGAADYRC